MKLTLTILFFALNYYCCFSYTSVYEIQSDTIRVNQLKKIIKDSYRQKNWKVFNQSRYEQIQLAAKLNDIATLAKTYEYIGSYFRKLDQIDSTYFHFYKSFKLFDILKDSLKAGRILLNLAILQKNTRDYKGSEDTSLKALLYLKNSKNIRRISSIYNNLGVVYNEQGDIINAIKYHQKSLDLRRKMKNPLYFVYSLNNLGKLYKDDGQYNESLTYFERALQYKDIIGKSPRVRATIIDNKAHTLFKKGDNNKILETFLEALSIREKENDKGGIIISCIHLAEYYNVLGERGKAIEYAERAEKISLEVHNFRDYLVSLDLVSSMYESPKAQEHFKKYIAIRDSIDRAAVKFKNQFDRIRFEDDEKEKTIKIQSSKIQQKNNIILFIVIIIFITILLISIYNFKNRKAKRILQSQLKEGFNSFLKDKYRLSNQNLEFWDTWVNQGGQEIIAEKLFITVDAVKSRRRSLKNRLIKIEEIQGDFDRANAIILYKKNWEFYKDNIQNS